MVTTATWGKAIRLGTTHRHVFRIVAARQPVMHDQLLTCQPPSVTVP